MLRKLPIKVFLILIMAIFAMTGCKREGEKASDGKSKQPQVEKAAPAKKPKPKTLFDRLSPTSVVVRVDKKYEVTKADLLAWWDARVKVFVAGRGVGMADSADEARRYRASCRDRVLAELVRNTMILSYAEKRGITAKKSRIVAFEKKAMSEVKKPKMAFATFAKSLGVSEGEMFTRMIHEDALAEAVIETFATNDLYHVTEAEFSNRVAFVKSWNERTDATNKIVRLRAAQAKKEILAGGQFEDVAKKYADFSPEEGKLWQRVQLDELDGDDPLCQWLLRANVGDISDPIDVEDGCSIVGLQMKYPGEEGPDGQKTLETYELVRCAFHAFDKVEDYGGDRKLIIQEMLEERRSDLMLELREKLKKESVIEFPNGTNLFELPEKKKRAKKGKRRGVSGKRNDSPGGGGKKTSGGDGGAPKPQKQDGAKAVPAEARKPVGDK